MDIFGTAGGLWTNKENIEFAEQQASTQYQRATADMKAAGLNPMAVFGSGGGSPAAAPGGQATNPVAPGGGTAQNIINTYRMAQQAKKDEAEADTARSTADVITKENSAYKTALESEAGKASAVAKKYTGAGPLGWLGGAGAVAGFGQGSGWGGNASAHNVLSQGAREIYGEIRDRLTDNSALDQRNRAELQRLYQDRAKRSVRKPGELPLGGYLIP